MHSLCCLQYEKRGYSMVIVHMLNDIDMLIIMHLTIAAVQPPDPPMFTQTVFQASVNETFDPTHPRPSDGFVTVACIDPVSGDPAVGIAYIAFQQLWV